MRLGSVALAALAVTAAGCPAAAQAAGSPSLSLSVPASVASGASVTATGTAKRAPRRARVVLQRRAGGAWVGLKRSGLTHGRFTMRFSAPVSAVPATLSVRALLVRGERRLRASATRTIAVRPRAARPLPPPPLAVPGPGPEREAADVPTAVSVLRAPPEIVVTAPAVRVAPGSAADVATPLPLTSITTLEPPTTGAPGVSVSVSAGHVVVTAARQAAPGQTALTVAGTGCTATACAQRFVMTISVTVLGPQDVAWSDEFNGSLLDLTRWSYRATGAARFDATVTPDAVSVGGGALTIKTYTEAGTHYVGMIGTQRIGLAGFEQRYGYFEARVKFDNGPGQWSAFWLQSPTLGNPIGDPATAGVEMDIAEHRTRCVAAPAPTPPETCDPDNDISDRIQQAMIWDGYGPDSKSAVRLSEPLPGLGNGSWHTWAVRWTPTDVTYYYDGVATWSGATPVSQRSQYIILSSDVGAFFAGAIPAAGYGSRDTSTTTMQVDYVRVWALD
jgi:beta-glucanase (GH16 family)